MTNVIQFPSKEEVEAEELGLNFDRQTIVKTVVGSLDDFMNIDEILKERFMVGPLESNVRFQERITMICYLLEQSMLEVKNVEKYEFLENIQNLIEEISN